MAKSFVILINLFIIFYICNAAAVEVPHFELQKIKVEVKNDSLIVNETKTPEIFNSSKENRNEKRSDVPENVNKNKERIDENGVPIVEFTRVDNKNESITNETSINEQEGCIADWAKEILEKRKNASKSVNVSNSTLRSSISSENKDGIKVKVENDSIGLKNDTGFKNETEFEISKINDESENNSKFDENNEKKNETSQIDSDIVDRKADLTSNVDSITESSLDSIEITGEVNKNPTNIKPSVTKRKLYQDTNTEKITIKNSTLNDNGEVQNSDLVTLDLLTEENTTSPVEIQKRNTENRTRTRNSDLKIESRTLSHESDYADVEVSDRELNETEILSKYGNIMRIEKFEKLFEDSGDKNDSIGDLGVNVPEVQDVVGMQHGPRHKRKTKSAKEKLWPRGIVYYEISDGFSDDEANTIILAMKHIALRTKCIKFHPYTGKQKDWIKFKLGHDGCRANTGRQGGRQYIMLEVPVCVSSDPKTAHNVAHELGHILGLHHEHTRGDRDKYIEILWENIEKGEEINFRKEKDYLPNVPYSYNSIMHYSQYAFSPAGLKSMIPKMETKYVGSLGVYDKYDVDKVRQMYLCEGYDSYLE